MRKRTVSGDIKVSQHQTTKLQKPKKPYLRAAIARHTVPTKYGVTPEKENPFKILSEPEKMPCPTFSLPAKRACPFAVFCEGSICSDCYACKGRYVMPNVIAPRAARYSWVLDCLKTEEGKREFVTTLVDSIVATKTEYVRGHDSGDFFNPKYVDLWIEICSQLPSVRFWFPTRAWQDGTGKLNQRMLTALRKLSALPNVQVKPSALMFGDAAPQVEGLGAGSTSNHEATRQCVAPSQDGYCGDCRACWFDNEISYKHH